MLTFPDTSVACRPPEAQPPIARTSSVSGMNLRTGTLQNRTELRCIFYGRSPLFRRQDRNDLMREPVDIVEIFPPVAARQCDRRPGYANLRQGGKTVDDRRRFRPPAALHGQAE